MKRRKEIVNRVSNIYNWLDEELSARSVAAGACGICGKCCDFESFGHRLFVTTPEMLFFANKIGSRNITGHFTTVIPAKAGIQESVCNETSSIKISGGRCPYQVDGKCSVYEHRFASCRIFCCKGNPDFQSELSEAAVKKFKALCDEFQIPYRYVDLPTALKDFLTTKSTKIHRDSFEF